MLPLINVAELPLLCLIFLFWIFISLLRSSVDGITVPLSMWTMPNILPLDGDQARKGVDLCCSRLCSSIPSFSFDVSKHLGVVDGSDMAQ